MRRHKQLSDLEQYPQTFTQALQIPWFPTLWMGPTLFLGNARQLSLVLP